MNLKSPNKSEFRERNLKVSFDNLLNGSIAFYLYFLIYAVGKTRASFILNLFKRDADSFYRKTKYLDYKFRYYFKSLRFIEAYSLRIKLAIYLEENKKIDRNYLDVIWQKDFSDLFSLSEEEKNYLLNRKRKLNFVQGKDKENENMKILFFGPSANLEKIKSFQYDYVCLTKPIPLDKLGINPKKVILILNNMWSLHKVDAVTNWIHGNKGARVFSPNKIRGKDYNSSSFLKIPTFGLGSLMGLQRALSLVISELKPKEVCIEGFDFYLSDQPIKAWYPSLYKQEGFINQNQGILFSNLNHDFLLNFLFIKYLRDSSTIKITGGINKYLEIGTQEALTKLKENLSK